MNISEITSSSKNISVEATVSEISSVKEFNKFGKTGRVYTAVLEDDSGKIQLTLWDEQIDKVVPGIKVRILNAYVKEWQGEMQLNLGRYGTLEVMK